ncbi:zinc finger protein Xfin-like isoform X1 [Ostrinia furnacalis]|uniref:zinc finger protein Xfin-like isoform X1 n=2 Tax=Ostrinia furnacalis TaxID=93504 RepID=UPI00103E29A1|nr:zinc finger protein Xfin-like isoform X1 [Ostrinia furnacalis]XP_028179454.1 zinc finger protein Xfin-like isoform X1 [Ostrinia furnacalis]
MLQQMSSPSSAQVGEVGSLVRPFEGRLCDASSEASSDAAEEDLPQCKIRRNYNCAKCTYYTQNPRAFLVHTRDVHFERFKIYDCPSCVYASRHHQKLIRHIKMVHGAAATTNIKVDVELPAATETAEPVERIEDLLEEIEECDDDIEIDVDDCCEESFEVDGDKSTNEEGLSILKSENKYFSCTKCNYATHIKSRFTKHVKYHSMPMNKCTICDFRSPYKWNLDRHMKNHGGSGSFKCFMCNFTADIKQSLTSHELNHHASPAGQSVASRRRNRVGASDIMNALVMKEEEGSDSRSSCSASEMGLQCADKEMLSCNSDSNDAADGRSKNASPSQDIQSQQSPNAATEESKSHKNNRKVPRPLPQLIPLHTSTPTNNKTPSGEPPAKKFKENPNSESTKTTKFENLPVDITLIPVNNIPINTKENVGRKKNNSFFDKLKERLLTETGEKGSLICKNCGFESKCLSEHSVHEKNCASQLNKSATNTLLPSLSSTRCQNCRHRCKSSADLIIHMKTCRKIEKMEDDTVEVKSQDSNDEIITVQDRETEPHPMENVVFVWNNINQDSNKFDTPLDININDDSTLPEMCRSFDLDIAEDNEGMNLSPSQAMGKKVFKCPHCPFWASTASRFHVHIVGHLNKKPFKCSLCKYKSNWRWDITKHIKLKSARDPEHNEAKVLMTDETGRRNYSKYNKFLAMSVLNENGETVFHYIDQNPSAHPSIEGIESYNDMNDNFNHTLEVQPLNLQMNHSDGEAFDNRSMDQMKPKKTLWKCKKCNYRDPSKEALLEHVREHSTADGNTDGMKPPKKPDNVPDPADLAYRCGHCNQLSNWKHVIQRHCRLKHDGIIKVITTVKPKPDPGLGLNDIHGDTCNKCPFKTSDKKLLLAHLQQHQPSPQSIFKCFFCPYFVKDEHELIQHLILHGVNEPEEYIARAMGAKSPIPEPASNSTPNTSSTKRHKCTECPYETNSKSQYMYHEQFHRLPADTPYKCPECNYSVSKRHLLHQHLRVHGINSKKLEAELESKTDLRIEINLDEIPFVWVSAKNEFHKMYKCRYCSYVNSQKCKIPNHEKIHCVVFENSEMIIYKCLECKYTCDSAVRLAEHSRTHGEIYGRIYCPVDADIPDEEQIAKLRKVIEAEKNTTSEGNKEDEAGDENKESKTLYFCQKCPARFFADEELKNHDNFHNNSALPHKCPSCEFYVPEESELSEHTVVHSDEYHTKTKMLKFIHSCSAAHRQPNLDIVLNTTTTDITWGVSNPSKNYNNDTHKGSNETKPVPKQYACKECPARFIKSSALTGHMALHGSNYPHKCKLCSYAVRNTGNLAKHVALHENDGKASNCDYESGDDNMDFKNIPLSGTDLFQRKTEAQKRVLIDKDKLVKPNDHFPPVLQADPQFGYLMHGNPEFIYPTYLKNGRQKEKRYKCHKCPSAFEKREQYKIHLSLHGSKQRYKCELCDYSVKYYANYVQHMRKHQMNDEAQAERKKTSNGVIETETQEVKQEDTDNIKLAIKTMPKGTPKSDFQQFSFSDQQTLRILQRRRSLNNSGKEQSSPSDVSHLKDRKLHMCLLCPYTNQRQDALFNHYKRHDDTDVSNLGNHKCNFCDLVVVQSHFLRDHLKTHFTYQKTLTPECYVANENVSFTITKVDDEDDAPIDLKLDMQSKKFKCNEDKIFVKIQTGELMVE